MATLMSLGYCITQNEDYTVLVTRQGVPIIKYIFSRPLSGEELNDLAYSTAIR